MSILASVIGRGVLASRPAAGSTGRLYEATDTTPPTVYRDNGSSWDAYATIGVSPDQALLTYVDYVVAGAPASPAAGNLRLYAKTGGHMAQKDSAGVETLLDAAGGGGGGGSGTSIDQLKPGTPTYDFAAGALPGAFSAHSSQGGFATTDTLLGVGDLASRLRMNFQEKMGALYVSHANSDFTMQVGLLSGKGGMQGAAGAMFGIAGLDSSGTGVGLVAYNDGNVYLANITAWNYASVIQSFGAGHSQAGSDPYWLKLVRATNLWTGYVSLSGDAWGTGQGGSVTITLDRLAIGMFYNTGAAYRAALEVDWIDIS